MITFKVDTADVILNDLGDGQGKIIISDTNWGYNFSYYWGSMGGSLVYFLCRINSDYFTGKLGPTEQGPINNKKTVKQVRKAIKEYFSSEYPWYKEKEFQKELRYNLKRLEQEGFSDVNEFFYIMERFTSDLDYYLIDDKYDRENIESIFKSVFSEPWNYIVYDEHRQNIYLNNFHKKLVKELKKKKLTYKSIEAI